MTAQGLMTFAQYWLYAGGAVAVVFLTFGMDRIDEDARGAYIFRPLLIPGILLIWPIVLWRWLTLETGRDDWRLRHLPERAAHGRIWLVLCVLLPLIVIAGLAIRQTWPADTAPQLIEAAQ